MNAVIASPHTLPTRIFKSGNSLAVRIPREMLMSDVGMDAVIEAKAGAWIIRPVHKRTLAQVADKFRAFSPGFMAQGRAPQEQAARDW
jgi:antitoxin VapB